MPRHVNVKPLWSRVDPDPRLDVGKLAHLAPTTTEHIIEEMKADQRVYLERELLGQKPVRRSHPPVFKPVPMPPPAPVHTEIREPIAVGMTATATAVQPEPVPTPAVRPLDEVLAGLHPLLRADTLRRCEGDLRRVEVLSPTRVRVRNRPC